MATGVEILGAVGTALQLVGLASKAVMYFSDMATGFKDVNGKIAHIHQDLHNFKGSAKFAHHNLDSEGVDDLDLKHCLIRYEETIEQLRHKMTIIRGRKKLWGQTKMWMQLMKCDGEVNMLRAQLRQHTDEIFGKFTISSLVQIKKNVKAIGRDLGHIRTTTQTIHEDVRAGNSRIESQLNTVMLSQQNSEEDIRLLSQQMEAWAVQTIETPVMSAVDLHDDEDFTDFGLARPSGTGYGERPGSVYGSPPGTDSPLNDDITPERSPSPTRPTCFGAMSHNNTSTESFYWAYCDRSDCDAHSVDSHASFEHDYVPKPSS